MTPNESRTTTPPVRTASLEDVDAIVTLTNLAFLKEAFCVTGDRTDADDIRQRFGKGVFFLIDDPVVRGRLTGSVFCSVENSRGYLGLLSIHPDAQGRGLSRVLLAAVEQQCRDTGCSFLDITVVNVRDDLFPVYARLGFAACDVLPFPVQERARMPLYLVKMTKPLLPPGEMRLQPA